jgi:2-phosphosulfolactate phosphatase
LIRNNRKITAMSIRKLETCFSPALFIPDENHDSIVVIIDVFRASSSICTAFENGAVSIIPVSDVAKAKDYKSRGYIVAGERDGYVLDFADFGNSPFNFTKEKVSGQTIVYSTTNGTTIINLTSSAHRTVIGSFLNITALTGWLIRQDKNVLLQCAGWKNRFNIEDTICAGAFAEILLKSNIFKTICDSTNAALDLWSMAASDLSGYIEKAAQRTRLRDKKLDDCIEFCLKPDFTGKIPILKNGVLVCNNT